MCCVSVLQLCTQCGSRSQTTHCPTNHVLHTLPDSPLSQSALMMTHIPPPVLMPCCTAAILYRRAAHVGPDRHGQMGVFLTKDLPKEAAKTIEKCLKVVVPKILTWSQYAEAAVNIAQRKWYGKDKVAPYNPDFTQCVDHFLIHAGKTHGCDSGVCGFWQGPCSSCCCVQLCLCSCLATLHGLLLVGLA